MARFTIGESIKFYLMGKNFHKLLKRKDSDAGERGKVLNELRASLFNDLRTSDGLKHQQHRFCGPRLALSFNFLVAVGIIMINKLLLGKVGFNYPIFLTLVHYGLSWIFMAFLNAICLLPTAPPAKSTSFPSLVALGMVTAFSNGLANVSLKFNSVGFYQMAKIAVTPTIVLTEFLFLGKRVSFQKALSLMVVSFGVAIATVTDLQFNLFGALVALAWIVPSATNKILWSNLQQQDNWTALGLMWKTTPVTVFSLVALMPWLDPPGLLTFNWNISNTLAILISAALGFLLQWSGALALGATSATTHVVLGQFKTCIILLGGFLAFQSDPGIKSLLGVTMALAGMAFYTYLNLHETDELLVKKTIIKENSFSSLKPKSSKSSGDNHDGKDCTDIV
uniref:NST1 n=1 Tax=Pinus tabuliformis TaxID=88731 RepID=A0A0K0M734_PINTB|nr:NST1 [Pinus tabuliformis]